MDRTRFLNMAVMVTVAAFVGTGLANAASDHHTPRERSPRPSKAVAARAALQSTPVVRPSLLGCNPDGLLFELDVATADATVIGCLPGCGSDQVTEIVYDQTRDQAWFQTGKPSTFAQRFDPATGEGIGDPVPNGESFDALEFILASDFSERGLYGAANDHCLRMLMAPADDDDPNVRALIAGHLGGIVDYFDARQAPPSAGQMKDYDVVYTWSTSPFNDPTDFGDRLADYADLGGRVILGAGCAFIQAGFNLGGRIMTPGYAPVLNTGGLHPNPAWVTFGEDCVFPGACCSQFVSHREILQLQGDGLMASRYADGIISVARRPDFRVVYANGTAANSNSPGRWAGMISNIVLCSLPKAKSRLEQFTPSSGGSTTLTTFPTIGITGLARDSTEAILYGIGPLPACAAQSTLMRFDLPGGAMTMIGPAGFDAGSLEFGPDGELYGGGVGADAGKLFRIDRVTGVGTSIGQTGHGDLVGLMLIKANLVDVPDAGDRAGVLAIHWVQNPVSRDLVVGFELASGRNARLELVDVAGRRVTAREVGALGPGRHRVSLGEASEAAPGVYFLRLHQAGRVVTRPVSVIR